MKERDIRLKLVKWTWRAGFRRWSGRQANHWACCGLMRSELGDARLYKLNNGQRNPEHPHTIVIAEIIGEVVNFEWDESIPKPRAKPSRRAARRAAHEQKLEEEREVARLKLYEKLPPGYGGWA